MNLEKINVGGNEYDISDPKAREMVSEAYDQAKQYAAGNFCINNNKLYKCTSATTGVWDATKWKETNLAEIASELTGNSEWKLLKTATGTNSISISDVIDKAHEFLAEVKFKGSTTAYLFGSITIPKEAEAGTRICGYYYSSAFSGAVGVYYNKANKNINIDGNWSAVAGNNTSGVEASLTVFWR